MRSIFKMVLISFSLIFFKNGIKGFKVLYDKESKIFSYFFKYNNIVCKSNLSINDLLNSLKSFCINGIKSLSLSFDGNFDFDFDFDFDFFPNNNLPISFPNFSPGVCILSLYPAPLFFLISIVFKYYNISSTVSKLPSIHACLSLYISPIIYIFFGLKILSIFFLISFDFTFTFQK